MVIVKFKFTEKKFLVIAILFAVNLWIVSNPSLVQATSSYQAGDLGQDIADIQSRLNSLGFNVGSADGVFGKMTETGVKEFQTARGLEITGIIDAVTYRALMERDIPEVSRDSSSASLRRVIQTAMNHVGVPYAFGGTTPRGFDCSGFARFAFGQAGINLPRMADEQYGVGIAVPYKSLQPGDLVFFTTYTSGVSHVGIYLGDSRFISATSSSGVKITYINDSYWGPRYVGARRVF